MKKKLKFIMACLLVGVMLFGNFITAYAYTTRQIQAFEAKWGSDWWTIEGSQEFKNYLDWNRGYWDNPTEPPASFNWMESSVDVFPRDDSRWAGSVGSTATATPAKPKCDHSYDMIITKDLTCVEAGIAEYTCSKCGDDYTMELEASGAHEYESSVAKEASCTETGELLYDCVMCEDSYIEEIPMLEHKYSSEVTVKVGCVEDGKNTFICELCSDSYEEPIPARGHSEGDFEITVENGWFTEGEQVQRCVSCEEILATEIIPSQYPIWYLYSGIGVGALLIVAVVIIVLVTMKKRK